MCAVIHSVIITFPSGRLQRTVLFLFQALMNHLWFGKSLKEAIASPVVFVDSENALKFEPNFDEVNHCIMHLFGEATHLTIASHLIFSPFYLQNVIKALEALGHTRGQARHFYNVVNAVEKENGCICAVSDARKMGKAAGYWEQGSVTLVPQNDLKVTEIFLQSERQKTCNRLCLSCRKMIELDAE